MVDRRDPLQLAGECTELPRPWLVGVDVDGTLAPIVSRPELSRLEPDAREALDHLATAIGVMVAVVSGRPMTDLRHRFDLPSSVILLGSHGAEVGSEVDKRTDEEERLITSTVASLEAITATLPGSWVEHKPLAVALHVRQADDDAGEVAIEQARQQFLEADDLTIHRGHKVLELAIRPVSKTTAFGQLRRRLEPATTFFIGDDQSDEHVFASLLPTDVSIKVGIGPTMAHHRLASPTEVVAFLRSMAEHLTPEPPRPTSTMTHTRGDNDRGPADRGDAVRTGGR